MLTKRLDQTHFIKSNKNGKETVKNVSVLDCILKRSSRNNSINLKETDENKKRKRKMRMVTRNTNDERKVEFDIIHIEFISSRNQR